MSRIWVPDDVSEKRKMLQDLFSNPHLLPPSLLAFLNDYNALNQPPLPASQIIGISGFLERLDTDTDTVTIQNSTAETTIYSYDVPAGLLQKNGAFQTQIQGTWLQNSGSTPTLRMRVKYGATTMFDHTSDVMASSTDPTPWVATLTLANRGSASVQQMIGTFFAARHSSTVGTGRFFADAVELGIWSGNYAGTAAEDSTLLKTFSVTMQTNVAHANNKFDKLIAHTTRIAH